MKRWINTNTGEEFAGDTLGTIAVSYDEHTQKTSFYLGRLDIVALSIDGELDEADVEQYIQDYLANWEAVEETATVEITRRHCSGSHTFDLTFNSLEDAQKAIVALEKSTDILTVKIARS